MSTTLSTGSYGSHTQACFSFWSFDDYRLLPKKELLGEDGLWQQIMEKDLLVAVKSMNPCTNGYQKILYQSINEPCTNISWGKMPFFFGSRLWRGFFFWYHYLIYRVLRFPYSSLLVSMLVSLPGSWLVSLLVSLFVSLLVSLPVK